jgi:3-keto-5-aminohexanoate cleavage enzyme
MITAACGQARPPGGEPRADTPAEVAESVYQAYRAGACIAQIRAPSTHHPETGRPITDMAVWTEMLERIRDRCDILVHFGVAAMQIEDRAELLDRLRPDLAAFLLGHHDLATRGRSLNSLRTREDCVKLAQTHLALGIKPEFEIFQAGHVWNLQYVLERVALPRPLYLTLFFGWEGGEWSPPTMEEYLHRSQLVPTDAISTLTFAGAEQLPVQLLAIARGGHVRVGLGDYPVYRDGEYAATTAQMVERVARLAEEQGRPLATPAQAREALGIGRAHAAAHA